MSKRIHAVIFDQDGLMFDTERMSVEAWNIAGAEMGIHLEESFLCTIRGMNYRDTEKRFQEVFEGQFDYNKLRQRKKECFKQLRDSRPLPVKPGLCQLLAYLKEKNYKIALATAGEREYSLRNLREAGVESYFEYIISGDMVTQAKPNPELFLKSAEVLGEKPEDCLVLEDSLNGVEAGIRGGFFTIMVPDLTQPDETLRSRVNRVCTSLLEVKEFLENEDKETNG